MPYEEQLADRLRIALTDHDAVYERKIKGNKYAEDWDVSE